ncbi:MAG TPA: PQQ-binding-like beta-propeller repeat protein [Planctomycetaceae bacterium]
MRVRRFVGAVAVAACCGPSVGQEVILDGAIFQPLFEGAIVVEAEPAAGHVAPGELQGSIALPEDDALRRRLAQATRLLENGRHEDAAQALGRLAEAVGDADVFVRSEGERQSLRSLKAEVQRRIGDLPPEAKEAYELAFGRAARRMLDDAPYDPATVRRVATLYLHTEAGAEALYRLAGRYRDQGAFAEAAACLDRLRTARPEAAERFEPHLSIHMAVCRMRSGDEAGAEAVLGDAARRFPDRVTLVAGEGVKASALPDDLLGPQPTHAARGDFTRRSGNADLPIAEAGEPFLVPRWSQELALVSTEADTAARRSRHGRTVPALFPTVVGDLVLLPAGAGFIAYDRGTGRPLWSYPSEEEAPSPDDLWTRLAAGRLSTDGRAVFLVEADAKAEPPAGPAGPNGMFVQQQVAFFAMPAAFAVPGDSVSSAAKPVVNILTALDVSPPRQGNRLWSVGGESGGDEPRLAGHAFLGPPLAAHGRLYAIAEQAGTVRLVVLDAETGRLDWSLDLGHAETPLAGDPQRLRIGATPTLARSVLYCPTAGGAVVAVDLAGRSLLWGYRYPRFAQPDQFAWGNTISPQPDMGGWLDGTVRVAGGRVLLTPPESGHLYCLDALTGDLLWQRPREEHLFVAAADSDRVLLVGRAGASLLKLVDGAPAAPVAPFASGAVPTGRGYVADGSYVLPLSDGSFARIDLATGSSDAVARSDRGIVGGNLVWHAGVLFSAGPDFLRAFDDRSRLAAEVEARLASAPDDAAALLRRADLRSAEGRYAEAIDDCRRAYAASPSAETRSRLVAALLDGVRYRLPDAPAYDAELDRLARPH